MPRRTKLIDDAKRSNPQYRGLIHGTVSIVKQEGIFGIYRGLFPVVCQFSLYFFAWVHLHLSKMMRQGANSAVRFTTYATLKQFVQGTARPGQQLPSAITFGIGGIAGLVTVYTTMPLEYVSFINVFSFLLSSHSVSSKRACNLWRRGHNTATPFIVHTAYLRKKGYCDFGQEQRQG